MSRRRNSPYRLLEVSEWHRWLDADLAPEALVIVAYLRTGPRTTRTVGLVAAGPGVLAEDLGFTPEAVAGALDQLEAAGLVRVDPRRRVVYVPGAVGHDLPANPNAATSAARDLASLPPCEAVGWWLAEIDTLPESDGKQRLLNAVNGEGTTVGSTVGPTVGATVGPVPSPIPIPIPIPIEEGGGDFLTVECQDGRETITGADLDKWQASFPTLDVPATVRHAAAWCEAKPTGERWKRKGLRQALVGWLGRERTRAIERKPATAQDVPDLEAEYAAMRGGAR